MIRVAMALRSEIAVLSYRVLGVKRQQRGTGETVEDAAAFLE
jgi:hypothetical protein